MNRPNFTTSLVAAHGRWSLSYLTALLTYYLYAFWYYPLAYMRNQSYLLYHPDQPLPISVAPPWNRTLRSFHLNSDMFAYITHLVPRSPATRRWRSRREIADQVLLRFTVSTLQALSGELHGPNIRQGMLVYQGRQAYYIKEEFGRMPTREDLITTLSYALGPQIILPLFIPIQYIDTQGLYDPTFRTPFRETPALTELIQAYQRVLPSLSDPLPV